jgi:hypothetical protein
MWAMALSALALEFRRMAGREHGVFERQTL